MDTELTLLPWCDVQSLPGVRDDLVETCNDPEMVRWTTVPHPYTEAQGDDFLEAPPAGVERWAYVVGGRYAGNIELRENGLLGYSTAPWARGRGITTRAVRLVTAHAFTQGFQRLEIHVAADNSASRRVAEKAGFTLAGHLPDPVCVRGHEDLMVRYVLAAEAAPNSTAMAP